MPYCTVSDVRVLTGITESMLTDSDIESLITLSDQQIDDDIAPSEPSSARVKYLSALLTAIKIYTRPDVRDGFTVGDISIGNKQVEEALAGWEREVKRIYAYYGKVVQESPSTLRRT